jgi:hypothetical protein
MDKRIYIFFFKKSIFQQKKSVKSITRNLITVNGAEFYQTIKSNEVQAKILANLQINFSHANAIF